MKCALTSPAVTLAVLAIPLATPLAASVAARAAALGAVGQGVQIYTCAATPSGAAWKLKAPDATLRDAQGHVLGHHFAGPTWQAADGSTVVGAPVAASAAPNGAGIPWLVLQAVSHAGTGIFTGVTYITRTQTEGGKAPATGCNTAHLGAETRVAYNARYTFFTP
jgi:hypothetical protein